MEDTVEYFGLNDWLNSIQEYFFAGIPEHYPFQKKLVIYRANSKVGDAWDIIQILLVIVTAILYAVTRYPLSYELSTSIFLIEVIITQLFMVDFLLNCYLQTSLIHFLIDYITIIDMLTMLPVYLILGGVSSGPVNFFRCLRIVRLMRMFRTVKYIKNLNPVRRQVVNLVITLISMIYLAGSVIQLMEADLHQLELMCSHINAYTHWKPSCSPSQLVDDETCDCKLNNCIPFYQYGDVNHEPSSIRCDTFSFYQAVYFVIVTMSTVGYGDISANTDYGRVIVIIFIIGSLIVIPSRLNELQRLLSMRSPYSKPYTKTHASDKHVIICGHVNNKLKLERFFQEFFHEDQ